MNKIRTLDQLQDVLDREFSWRLKEIATLKLVTKGTSGLSDGTLVRAGVPLVYAHWEGFIKQSSEAYLRFITDQKLKYDQLTSCFVVFGVKKYLSSLVVARKAYVNIEAVDFFRNGMSNRADLVLSNAIETESNLSSAVFRNIALSIGIRTNNYDAFYKLIDESLLARRNGIAHGEFLDLDVESFRALAEEVISLLRMFKTDIENLASTKAYLLV